MDDPLTSTQREGKSVSDSKAKQPVSGSGSPTYRNPNIYDMRVTDEIVKESKATGRRAADILTLILKNYLVQN